ncbi:hypothetical protein GN956_G21887 [Arapaima gigas]
MTASPGQQRGAVEGHVLSFGGQCRAVRRQLTTGDTKEGGTEASRAEGIAGSPDRERISPDPRQAAQGGC